MTVNGKVTLFTKEPRNYIIQSIRIRIGKGGTRKDFRKGGEKVSNYRKRKDSIE